MVRLFALQGALVKRQAPLALLLVAFAYFFFSSLDSHGGLMWDEAEYANLGRDIQLRRDYGSHFRPPILPLAVAAVLSVEPRPSDATLKIPNAIAGLLGLSLLYTFLSKERDQTTGLVGAACLGAMPAYWIHTTFLLSEIPFLIFFGSACFCFYKGLYGPANSLYLAWGFTGLAFLTRYTCVLLGPIFALFVLLGLVLDRSTVIGKLKSREFWTAPFVGLLIQLPWLYRQYSTFGDPLVGFRYAAGQLQRYAPEISMPAQFYIAEMPSQLTIPIFTLTLLGTAWVLRTRNRFGLHVLLVSIFLLCWFSAYRYKEFRLITSILPFLATLAGLGYSKVFSSLWSGFSKPWTALAVALSIALCSNYLLTDYFRKSRVIGYPSLKKAVATLDKHLKDDSLVMVAPSPQFAWYSGHKTRSFPSREKFYEELKSVDFVVAVTYERGQPKYVAELVRELFKEPPNELNKYFLATDQFRNITFVTSGPEFQRRIELYAASKKKDEAEPLDYSR